METIKRILKKTSKLIWAVVSILIGLVLGVFVILYVGFMLLIGKGGDINKQLEGLKKLGERKEKKVN